MAARNPMVAVVVLVAGCDRVFGVDPPVIADVKLDEPYDRCAATVAHDPLRYRQLMNPNTTIVDGVEMPAPYPWEQARSECFLHGMDLIVLNDEQELGQLEEAFAFWIGQKRVAGAWSTVDGCPPYTPDAIGRDGMECGVVEDALLVSTTSCEGTLPPTPDDPSPRVVGAALCETPRPVSATCGARPVEELQFLTSASPLSRAAAIEFCESQGATLVEIDSHAEWTLAGTHAHRFWLNATFDGARWTTQSGCPMLFSWSVPLDTVAAGSCVATTVLEDMAGPRVDGVAPTACDAADVFALCER